MSGALTSNSAERHPLGQMLSTAILTLAVGAAPAPSAVFDKVWAAAKTEIYDQARSERFFTDDVYRRLKARAAKAADLDVLARDVLNPFLATLGVSHTAFFTEADLTYYLLRSLFSLPPAQRSIYTHKVHHIGVQLAEGRIVREIFEGFPADRAGLRRGDMIVAIDDQPYRSVQQYRGANRLTFKRQGVQRTVPIAPIHQALRASLLQAMNNSVRIVERNGRRIGYIHLWIGTHEHIRARFAAHIQAMGDIDGLILDLRGGFGGAWHEYLDPFFRDRSSYFGFEMTPRRGEVTRGAAEPRTNPNAYRGPMVVLINEGVRSGKESLAFQFKKTGRARLIGTTTKGAFTAGRGFFADQNDGYLFYLAVAELKLDGTKIEGVGVAPDIRVPYPLDPAPASDPQLQAAWTEIAKMLDKRNL